MGSSEDGGVMDKATVKHLVGRADNMILLIMASGGYKYREMVPKSNVALDEMIAAARQLCRFNLLALAIAEEMLGDGAQRTDRREELKLKVNEAWKEANCG
jgi:hypothetical protein